MSQTPDAGDHSHAGMAVPDEQGDRFGAPGKRVNGLALARLVGAAIDGCVPCQRAQLDVVQADPLTLTRLVELSAVAVMSIMGGLPNDMTTEAEPSNLSSGYRAMVRAGLNRDDDHAPMYALAVGYTDVQRRQVADDAMDMLTGVLVTDIHVVEG